MLRQFKRCLSLYVNCKVELSIDFLQNYLHSLHAVMLVRPGWSVSSVWVVTGGGVLPRPGAGCIYNCVDMSSCICNCVDTV